jgi:dCMP deaminase
MKRALVLYVPVLHAGYLKLFEKYRGSVDGFYLLSDELVAEFAPFHREIRALGAAQMKPLIESLNIFPSVSIFSSASAVVDELRDAEIVTSTDEICRKAIEKYLSENKVVYENVFLRWDEKNVDRPIDVKYDRVSTDPFDQKMCSMAVEESGKSSDWWRRVGAVVVKDGAVITAQHNHHVPSDHTPYINGDPRDVIKSGTLNLVYSSLHAEQTIIAESARDGVSLKGTDMYLNDFPCPLCAKLMAAAGIKRCFFKAGSTWLDAESVLHAAGVEIILVQ